MLAGGAALLEASHMYRSSLTLAFVVLYSAVAAASDLSSVYVAPGGIYAPSADVYVRPGPTYRQPPYAEPGYGYRQPSYYGTPGYGAPGPAYRAPASVYGEYGPAYAAQPVYVERAPAYPERYYAPERSEEHTSELQSPDHLVCRLLLEKKNITLTERVITCITARR